MSNILVAKYSEKQLPRTASDIRKAIESNWNEYLSKYANLFSSNYVEGSSPPSVFVGSYGYPKVLVGPMVPPVHGNTLVMDLPESWLGKSLEDIVNFRLSLVRGIQAVQIKEPQGRYIESLQELAMSSQSTDSEVEFVKNTRPTLFVDGENAPFGPVGEIKTAKFSNSSSDKNIQRLFYDKDILAQDAVLELYNRGIEVSKIQKCFSIGMFGKNRKLVPTKWSITATDDMISKSMVELITSFSEIDSCRLFTYEHLGNLYAVIMFPSRWMFEMQEAWYDQDGNIGFGSDFEDMKGLSHYPETAGAHFASRLAVVEYLLATNVQAGVMVLREIRPEYAIPVGVWQVREGVRMALKQKPVIVYSFEQGLDLACQGMSVDKREWLARSKLHKARNQKSIKDYF
jgi:hypothetical protein